MACSPALLNLPLYPVTSRVQLIPSTLPLGVRILPDPISDGLTMI